MKSASKSYTSVNKEKYDDDDDGDDDDVDDDDDDDEEDNLEVIHRKGVHVGPTRKT